MPNIRTPKDAILTDVATESSIAFSYTFTPTSRCKIHLIHVNVDDTPTDPEDLVITQTKAIGNDRVLLTLDLSVQGDQDIVFTPDGNEEFILQEGDTITVEYGNTGLDAINADIDYETF